MRHFVAVAEELHFGRAAKRLNMAQPPLSQSIQRLEADLGVALLNRTRREVTLTPAGAVFLAEARRTLMQADLARKLAERAAQQARELRVSFIGPALYCVLPEILIAFKSRFPDIHVRLFEQPSSSQIAGLSAGDFDLGFVTMGTAGMDRCDWMAVERSRFMAAMPADWPLAAKDSVSLDELVELPFIRPPEKSLPSESETLSIFKDIGLAPLVTQEAMQTNTTLSLVGVGVGCSIVMATARNAEPKNVKLLSIEGLQATRRWEMAAAWARGNDNPERAAFLSIMHDVIAANPAWLDPERD